MHSDLRVERTVKWWKTARGQLGIMSLVIQCWLPVFISHIIFFVTRPVMWIWPPPEYYFLKFYETHYGWGITAVFVVIGIIAQIFITRLMLHYEEHKEHQQQQKILLTVICTIFIALIVLIFFGTMGIAYLSMFMVSFLTPGFWPTYLTLLHCERKHQTTIRGFAFQRNTEAHQILTLASLLLFLIAIAYSISSWIYLSPIEWVILAWAIILMILVLALSQHQFRRKQLQTAHT